MMYRAPITFCTIGALLLIVAIVLPLVFPSIFDKKLNEKLILRPDSDIIESFKVTPVPLYLQIYLFNITNEERVLQGDKPILVQLGPYTYRMQRQRENLKFNHKAGTLFSKTRKFYYFEPELSGGKESDVVVSLNLVFTSLVAKASGNPITLAIFQGWASRFDVKPFMTRTAGDMLFHGFDEPLLKLLYPFTKRANHKLGKSGYYFLKNGSIDSETDIITGELGMEHYQEIVRLNGETKLAYWKTDRCNMINGTEGSQFARPISKTKPLYLFSPSLCRSVYFIYEKDTTLGPLTLRRFTMPPAVLRQSKENNCFCPNEFTCRSSIIDVSACKSGTPIIVSTPHFLNGEDRDINAVVGLNPNKEEHQTFLDVEPNTGVTMRGAKRVQINMPLRKYGDFPSLANITEIIFPIFWINESAVAPLDRATTLHLTLTVPIKVVKYGSWALLVTGLILVFIGFLLAKREYKRNVVSRSKRRQELLDKLFEVQLHESKLLQTTKTSF